MHSRICMWLVAAAALAGAPPAFAESVTLFRVFLNDGTAVVSYGEYARVGDRLVFSMPIGAIDENGAGNPSLHVVNLPVSAVNWTATEKYAESARYTHYLANSAESDYAALAGEVAATLNAIVLAKDAKARLTMAVDARRRLASWPKDHYGYRADDVREMLGLLDEAISGLRVAAGETSFAIDLVASAPERDARDHVPMLRTPTAAEAVTHAIAAAKATDIAVDRVSILRGVIAAIDDPRNALPASWARTTRRWAVHTIAQEARIEKTYAAFTSSSLKRATTAATRADVRGVERVLAAVVRRDTQLGRKRPEEINALIEQVKSQLDAARRLRLARDRWQERASSFRAYKKNIAPVLASMTRAQRSLDDIKGLAGSDAASLVGLGGTLAAHTKALDVIAVPDELKPAHALLTSAVQLAETAVKTRRQAAISGELQLAWDASSAAAGSMMLLTKAQEDMEAAVRLPEIR
ncbi:MAG TPA: hypothetical protein VFO48_07940 [Vicinamibacterales bacterium]|nr:hypothetical protein [Vicinamibacterales bacterium]